MGINDPGRRGKNPRLPLDIGLQTFDIGLREEFQIGDAVLFRLRMNFFQPGDFLLADCQYNLPQLFVRNIILFTYLVEQPIAFDAEFSLQRILRIIDAGMNDLAVPAADLLPESTVAFENEYSPALFRRLGGDGQANNTGSNDYNVGLNRQLLTLFKCFDFGLKK